jgi:hypothetical protein
LAERLDCGNPALFQVGGSNKKAAKRKEEASDCRRQKIS